MDTEIRHEDTKLHTGRRNKNEETENGEAIKRAEKYEEKARQSEKKIMVECMKEKEKKWRRK